MNKNRPSAKVFDVWSDWVTEVLLFLNKKNFAVKHVRGVEETPSS